MSQHTHKIPTNFDIPAGVDHRWIFVAGPLTAEIKPCGHRELTIRHFRVPPDKLPDSPMGFTYEQLADLQGWLKMVDSRELDWMEESIAHLRRLCF